MDAWGEMGQFQNLKNWKNRELCLIMEINGAAVLIGGWEKRRSKCTEYDRVRKADETKEFLENIMNSMRKKQSERIEDNNDLALIYQKYTTSQ